ncbi:cytochrome c peroxidase [Neolewinella lacunae]|uniref:Cytochrome-c peroxidase n=1 Tax=Neolewinella lacunae TaxID=1517758 RepID=A0A923PLQ4_9BACT|nr:cytochrome c peroxidase [Neolewinella lacunae]MBC6993513.1 cytochrome-c peroxidase [Neolewinella lacunae]MDN3636211.1 cytochrome c peroxidase [Neolewinella lacunae]
MRLLEFGLKFFLLSLGYISIGHTLELGRPYAASPALEVALTQTSQDLKRDMDHFAYCLDRYVALAGQQETGPADVRAVHTQARMAFKKIEYWLAFAQPSTVNLHLNGAPLPKAEPSVPYVNVIAPSGLQVLDELAFSEEFQREEILVLAEKLRKDYTLLHRQMLGIQLQHRYVFEALQQEAIRVFTLGVTGFDTPGSVAALPEAAVALQAMATAYGYYSPFVAARDTALDVTITAAFAAAQTLLRGEVEFSDFDRLRFLREVINPLTRSLPLAQKILDIESSRDWQALPSPVKAAGSLFDADWLNANYYANLTETDNSAARQKLGELLFFDPVLSANLQMSCASCHQPERAFTDGYPRSLGNEGSRHLLRNSPTLVNSVFAAAFFYDLREDFLERQMQHVVSSHAEFATDFVTLENRLRESREYRDLFGLAYADQPGYEISKWSISDALSHYVMGLQGLNSPFDRYARGETEEIAGEVRLGFNLFMGKAACGTCHFAPTFAGLVPPFYDENESEVLGVPASLQWEGAVVDPDPGRLRSGKPRDEAYFNAYAFKTPTVRNVSATAPYMHNGVYQTLHEVIDFYNRGGGAGIGIHLDHQTLPPDPLELADQEIQAIIIFMESLTDFTELSQRPEALPAFENHPDWNLRQVGGPSR